MLDSIEREYMMAIIRATSIGDNDEAYDLSLGLSEYREFYQLTDPSM